MNAKVFLPQIAERYDAVKQSMVRLFDFSAATQFGQLVPILSPEDDMLFLSHSAEKIRSVLADFTEQDYFLAVGDPIIIAMCASVILRRQKTLKMLKWDRRLKIYTSLEVTP